MGLLKLTWEACYTMPDHADLTQLKAHARKGLATLGPALMVDEPSGFRFIVGPSLLRNNHHALHSVSEGRLVFEQRDGLLHLTFTIEYSPIVLSTSTLAILILASYSTAAGIPWQVALLALGGFALALAATPHTTKSGLLAALDRSLSRHQARRITAKDGAGHGTTGAR